jgi:isopentenyl phosphate kinase
LQAAGLPVWRIQPSASLMSHNRDVTSMSMNSIEVALSNGLIPAVYGDVSLDSAIGGTIVSTEKLFFYLSTVLSVQRVFLLGEVSGVYDASGQVMNLITRANYSSLFSVVGGSAGVDVTGGMETKVEDMLSVIDAFPQMTIRIFSGLTDNLLYDALLDKAHPGTLISAER